MDHQQGPETAQTTTTTNRRPSMSQASETSQTAADYISSQLQLEADAREALPYQFDTCTYSLGPLNQSIFSCLTCNPPPSDTNSPYNPAGVCYACSISCHGEHDLVELFTRRQFVCDCGTTRLPATSACSLRVDTETGTKGGVHSEVPAKTNDYNQNFRNRFCGCAEDYNPHTEKGTMFQCMGLASQELGGCGEDWWHPECLMGLSRDWYKNAAKVDGVSTTMSNANDNVQPATMETIADKSEEQAADGSPGAPAVQIPPVEAAEEAHPVPPGFPEEEDFDHLVCYKCVDAVPWIKRYANSPRFLPPVSHNVSGRDVKNSQPGAVEEIDPALAVPERQIPSEIQSLKRKADDIEEASESAAKKPRSEDVSEVQSTIAGACTYVNLPSAPASSVSLFLKDGFRDRLCRCPACFPLLIPHPQLLEEEVVYEPPVSDDSSPDGDGTASVGSRSLLDRGEAALSNMDRVRAIEGVMAYNKLRDNLKGFLKPFAESGQAVGAEDIKKHFEKLRGDDAAMRQAQMEAAERNAGN